MTRHELIAKLHAIGIHKIRGIAIEKLHTYTLMKVYKWVMDKNAKLSELPVITKGDLIPEYVQPETYYCSECGCTTSYDEYMENNRKCLICGK